jgi:hypothetical protein
VKRIQQNGQLCRDDPPVVRVADEVLQVQAISLPSEPWSNSQRQAVHRLFLAARNELLKVLATR